GGGRWGDDVGGGDGEGIGMLGSWAGYCLVADTSQQAMLWMIGPSRAGKEVVCDVLKALVGTANVATPALHDLAEPFGLQSLLGKSLVVIGDARLGKNADAVLVTGRPWQIIEEEGVDVTGKNQPVLENPRLGCRFMVAANELPALVDNAEALLNRSLVLRFTRSFAGREDRQLER